MQQFWKGFVKRAGIASEAKDVAKAVVRKVEKVEGPTLNYKTMNEAAHAARRAHFERGASTINYANKKMPVVTPPPKTPAPKTPDFDTWSRINQQRRQQAMSGVQKS